MRWRMLTHLAGLLAFVSIIAGCDRPRNNRVQGYVEGEFVYVASPLAGQLNVLKVGRGDHVKAGDLLFALESAFERHTRDEAAQRLAQARSNLEDLKKSKRPSEIESAEAQLKQARSALEYSQKEYERQEVLVKGGASTPEGLDQARSQRDQDRHRVEQLQADLATAHLASREDQIAAAAATVQAQEAALGRAEWDLSQKSQSAPQAALVFDYLYREGEWVAAGRPVIALLPPENIKVRAFVPERRVGSIRPGQAVRVFVDGVAKPFVGRVSFISPQAEYTPPVIFSEESRAKLVFMIEAVFDPKDAANLHPGQPVDVEFGP